MSYAKISRWVGKQKDVTLIGEVGPPNARYPLHKIQHGEGKKVLFLAGVHGDEQAGPASLILFCENVAREYLKEFEFTIFPCVNPWGLDRGKHGNAFGLNVNREWRRGSICEEVRLIVPHLEQYVVAIDLHETMKEWEHVGVEPQGESPEDFFVYEVCADRNRRVGKTIVQRVEEAGHRVCKWPTIDGDINDGGVISYPEAAFSECYSACDSSENFLTKNGHTDHAFTIETPLKERLSDRVVMNLIAIRTILERYR